MLLHHRDPALHSSSSQGEHFRITNLDIASQKSKDSDVEIQSIEKPRKRFPPLCAGLIHDIKDKVPQYPSDWKDSWDYRVIPSVLETYFNNLLPALAFAQDMFDRTDNSYGVNEVLLSSAIAGLVFGIIGGQPLCIVGVTGPISIFNYTVYEIIMPLNIDYFGFMFWICIWSMITHFLLVIVNSVCLLQYVTTFPCDIFGLFINVVYIQKGIQILTRQFVDENSDFNLASGYSSIMVALLMAIFGLAFKFFQLTPLLTYTMRTLISDYSTALSVVFWSGFIHFGGLLDSVSFQKLPITKAFAPTRHGDSRQTWLAYQDISVGDVFLALPFGIVLTILFYFDHNVSSLMAQRKEYKLRKASTFHYDFALLGITTGIAGVLGIPAPNGLIPQAPLHTQSLLVRDDDGNVIRCAEQRFTNTVQGLMILGTMTRPFLICLGLIPQAVLSGLFFIMGIQGLVSNTIVHRIWFVFTDPKKKSKDSTLNTVSTKSLLLFISLSLVGFVAEFAITNTKGAIGFPIVLLLTVILSLFFPKIFPDKDLAILDEPVSEEFTLKNILPRNLI
ncbi:Bor1p [Kluyveromyces lactis]|uniref:KLLA0C02123p n=1 Tax=Kluyveromyces lactis (strain ATCC 8585 / CBS 2359 / DSM 70799 / NBRC 1267 / NRRL Y-1140 / WM37) TaxID=284590 RepID=Q6CUU8_KLULA|nr:uncharacterized protein KLLA0_C02123g [Kluyveromyces lactis]CAH01142.1 KLLA0C02123p [Kluyveromyces lactis]|eukprot:XP_452291.1 uncharacterized protein KLLA0_C02123g [Kluyveromyces lactis]